MTVHNPYEKQKPWRSRKYLDWVKSLPCCHCGRPADDPHHIIGIGNMSGVGTKADDWATMPLCRECHGQFHTKPELWPYQWEHVTRTLGAAIKEGIIK